MKRFLLLVAAFIAVSCVSRSASAQMGGMNFRNQTPMGEEIQKQRQQIMGQRQKYARALPRATAPAPRLLPRGNSDAFGRYDFSGRPAPGYPTIRDGSLNFSASRHSYSRGRRSPLPRPQARSPLPSLGTRRIGR